MGLILRPSEVKASAEQVRTGIENNRTGYSGALQIVQNFSCNEAFQSVSWNTAQEKIQECHQMIVQGVNAAQDSMLTDLDSMESSLAGEEDLIEDELLTDIMRLKEECERYEKYISDLYQMSSRAFVANLTIMELIKQYQELLKITREELRILQDKLETLYAKTERTSSLFMSISDLLDAVESAINDAQVYITGTGTLSDGTWKIVIPDIVEDINEMMQEEDGVNITVEQLTAFGWTNVSVEEVESLNQALDKYEIRSKESIILFMATCAAESGYGKYTLEIGDDKYFDDRGYTKEERGVGYIQLTHRDAHLEFLKKQGHNGEDINSTVAEISNTAEYIDENYNAWEVSAYTWATIEFGKKVFLNQYSGEKGLRLETFLAAEYFINGFPSADGFGKDLSGVVNQNFQYTTDKEKDLLVVTNPSSNTSVSYELPEGWEAREEAYYRAVEAFS